MTDSLTREGGGAICVQISREGHVSVSISAGQFMDEGNELPIAMTFECLGRALNTLLQNLNQAQGIPDTTMARLYQGMMKMPAFDLDELVECFHAEGKDDAESERGKVASIAQGPGSVSPKKGHQGGK